MAFHFFLSLTRDRLSLCLLLASSFLFSSFSFPHSLSPSASTLSLPLSLVSPLASSVRLHPPSSHLLCLCLSFFSSPSFILFLLPLSFLFSSCPFLVFPLSLSLCLFFLCLMRKTSLFLSPLPPSRAVSASFNARGATGSPPTHKTRLWNFSPHSCCSSTSTLLQAVRSMPRSHVCLISPGNDQTRSCADDDHAFTEQRTSPHWPNTAQWASAYHRLLCSVAFVLFCLSGLYSPAVLENARRRKRHSQSGGLWSLESVLSPLSR